MKIAIISSGFLPVIDGVTTSLYHRIRILSQLGHSVLILCPDYQPIESVYPNWRDYQGEILPGIRVISLPSEPFMGVAFERNFSGKANRHIQQHLESFAPEIIHVDEPDRIFLGTFKAPGVAYAKAHNIPCVGFYHTHFIDYIEDFLPLPSVFISAIQWLSMVFIRPVFHAYDLILTASPVTQQRLQQLNVKNTVCDRYLGVDVKTFKSQKKRGRFFQSQYGTQNLTGKIKLIFLGRLTPDKGWKFTLRALSTLNQQTATRHLLQQVAVIIAGDGELQATIATELANMGIETYFLGRVSPDKVPAILANSDIHITTSEKETLGLTILEAFAAGIPVIAPKIGGVITHIQPGENGLLYQPQDINSFGKALTTLVTDAELRHQMGQQGQQSIPAFDWPQAVSNLLKTWTQQIDHINHPKRD